MSALVASHSELLLSCPFRLAPDAVVESYEITRLLDSQSAKKVVQALPPQKALVCLEGILLQIQLMRTFVWALRSSAGEEHVVHALDKVRKQIDEGGVMRIGDVASVAPEVAAPAPPLGYVSPASGVLSDSTVQSSDESDVSADTGGAAAIEHAAMVCRPEARARAIADVMRQYAEDRAVQEAGAAALTEHYRQHVDVEQSPQEAHLVVSALLIGLRQPKRRSTTRRALLETVAAAVASPRDGGIFVERFAALGGLRALISALETDVGDEPTQCAGLAVLGHSRLLDHAVTRFSARDALMRTLAALARHARSPKLVGLAAITLTTIAHRDATAAAALADAGGCRLLVSSLFALSGPDKEVRAAHAAGCWALGTMTAIKGLRKNGELVQLVAFVKDSGAPELFAEARARFRHTSAARNAKLAQRQFAAALDQRRPPGLSEDDPGDDHHTDPKLCSLGAQRGNTSASRACHSDGSAPTATCATDQRCAIQ